MNSGSPKASHITTSRPIPITSKNEQVAAPCMPMSTREIYEKPKASRFPPSRPIPITSKDEQVAAPWMPMSAREIYENMSGKPLYTKLHNHITHSAPATMHITTTRTATEDVKGAITPGGEVSINSGDEGAINSGDEDLLFSLEMDEPDLS